MASPRTTTKLAFSVPALVLVQLLLAGLSIFHDAGLWPAHGVVGIMLIAPILVLTGLSFTRAGRHLHPAALFLFGFYVTQIALVVLGRESGNGVLLALHAGNAGLVLAGGLTLSSRASQ